MPKQRLNLLFSRKSGILVTVTVGVNHEASPAKLADKLSTRVGVMTRIVVYSRINVANAGHLLLDFLLKGSIKQQSELAQHMLAWRRFNKRIAPACRRRHSTNIKADFHPRTAEARAAT
jgi:hypothetical protein